VSVARRLLLSAHTRDTLATELQRALQGSDVQTVTLEDAAGDETITVDAAFISRDITGLSLKHLVLDDLAACYRVLRRSPQLRWVHTHSAGADRPIYSELLSRGVVVSTSSGANAEVVAQTALAGLLALSRRFPQLMAAQARREWAPLMAGPLPPDLAGQTAVLVGWGPIAQRLQPLLALLGLHVVVVRRTAEPAGPGIDTLPFTELQRALPRAVWLLLACPLTPQTQGLIDAQALASMPRGAQVINVSRGEVVVESALVAALQSGHLGGAFLDVFEHEPLAAESPLWSLPGVMVTPHSAGPSAGNAARTAAIFLDNLQRWVRGDTLRNRVHG
jgi:phosphoglycerate dehydrogenase-like enzyme